MPEIPQTGVRNAQACVALVCEEASTARRQMSEEPQGNTLWSNPMEANVVILEWGPESSHENVE